MSIKASSAAASSSSSPSAFVDPPGNNRLVLVTGANGFIAAQTVKMLLDQGYRVRGTVRNPSDKSNAFLKAFPGASERLELVAADLNKAAGWPAAVEGCDFVLHMASPFVLVVADVERDLIRPAVDGTLHVLRAVAATKGRVRRVVVTSSMAAVVYGHDGDANFPPDYTYTEADWSNEAKTEGYMLSKLKAERAAWDFVQSLPQDQKFELTTTNPVGVLGPILNSKLSTSVDIIKRLVGREVPGLPRLGFSIVDVRDVALANIRAMYVPDAAGQRFLLCAPNGSVWTQDVAEAVAEVYKPRGYNIPTGKVPSCVIKIAAWFSSEAASVSSHVEKNPQVDGSKATRILGIQYYPWREAVLASAEGVIEYGLVPRSKLDQQRAQ